MSYHHMKENKTAKKYTGEKESKLTNNQRNAKVR